MLQGICYCVVFFKVSLLVEVFLEAAALGTSRWSEGVEAEVGCDGSSQWLERFFYATALGTSR